MRKFYIMLAVLLLLVVGCNGQTSSKQENEQPAAEEERNHNQEQIEQNEAIEIDEEAISEETTEIVPAYRMNEKNYAIEPISDANPKVVLITIDDVPDKHALDMAKTLKALNAPAIFFVNGHFIHSPEKEQIIKEIYDLGFVIGNHTYSHSDLTTLTPEKQREEIISVNDQIEEITGERPKFFRAPFGINTDESRKIVQEENMLLMNWSYGYDWEKQYMTKDAIADIMVNTELLRDGANLLMHDREWTSAGLEQMIKGLREKGYEPLDPQLIDTKIH